MKVHIVSYNLDQNFFSKSIIHVLPNYEQTDLKTAIVWPWTTAVVHALRYGFPLFLARIYDSCSLDWLES